MLAGSFLFLQMTTRISIEDVRREVKILKALSNHNNLVKFYDACEDALNVYIVMEYALSKALTEDQLFYLRSQFKLLAPNGEGHISFDNFRMALLQNANEAMKESKVIDILNVARHPFLLPFFFQLLSFFCMPPPLPLLQNLYAALEPLSYRKMDFEEFCAAAISPHHLEALDGWEQMTSMTFEHFEREGNRTITVKELAQNKEEEKGKDAAILSRLESAVPVMQHQFRKGVCSVEEARHERRSAKDGIREGLSGNGLIASEDRC
ncbi:hypothetical protein ZIOFF_039304 [Zingiber officinale]|uniref:EF-hand domain-containing protein n=1 Tax=Zingiber officinale TaxID=94328 RepID=A0A8J5G324_ZINOF|nr:hypothetical protein ZIOFF_039304 [Zingiber officinale]